MKRPQIIRHPATGTTFALVCWGDRVSWSIALHKRRLVISLKQRPHRGDRRVHLGPVILAMNERRRG